MKIAILGSSFDPPHIGHLLLIQQVKEILGMDEIWLMPLYKHPFGKKQTNVLHRFAMAKLLENGFLKVSDFEIKQKSISYTIDTLNALKKINSSYTFYWIWVLIRLI